MADNFIVLEPDPVVRLDVEGMLRTAYPGKRITVGSSLLEIGQALHGCGPGSCFFVRNTLIAASSDLSRVLRIAAIRHSRIIVIGECGQLPFPAAFIDPPFSTEMLLATITGDHDALRMHP